MSCKACWTKESNEEAERWIHSNGYLLNIAGNTMRPLEKDFILCQYNLTLSADADKLTKDCNKTPVKYAI